MMKSTTNAQLNEPVMGREFRTCGGKEQAQTFRVLTYNVLADGPNYALSSRHSYCELQHRIWQHRYRRILKEIELYKADVICLQETTANTFRKDFAPDLHACGYRAFHAVRRHEPGYHTTAMFVNNAVFAMQHTSVIRYAQMAYERIPKETNPVMRELYQSLAQLDDLAIICHLRHRETLAPVVAVTTHLHFHPKNPHLKALQAWLMVEAMHQHMTKWNLSANTSMVVAGDFNSLPHKIEPDEYDPVLPKEGLVSGVYELMTRGALAYTHPDHPATRLKLDKLPLLRSPLRFSSAMCVGLGAEPELTTKTADFSGTLDYIFVGSGPDVVRVLGMPFHGEVEAAAFQPIPNAQTWPSDHLALVCDLAVWPEKNAEQPLPEITPVKEYESQTFHPLEKRQHSRQSVSQSHMRRNAKSLAAHTNHNKSTNSHNKSSAGSSVVRSRAHKNLNDGRGRLGTM